MSLRLAKLQKSDIEARKIKVKGLNRYKKIDEMLDHQGVLFVPKMI